MDSYRSLQSSQQHIREYITTRNKGETVERAGNLKVCFTVCCFIEKRSFQSVQFGAIFFYWSLSQRNPLPKREKKDKANTFATEITSKKSTYIAYIAERNINISLKVNKNQPIVYKKRKTDITDKATDTFPRRLERPKERKMQLHDSKSMTINLYHFLNYPFSNQAFMEVFHNIYCVCEVIPRAATVRWWLHERPSPGRSEVYRWWWFSAN